MGSMKKCARIYDQVQMPDKNEAQQIARERMGERWERLKEQRKNDANKSIEENPHNYYLCNLNFILIQICLLFLIHNYNFNCIRELNLNS